MRKRNIFNKVQYFERNSIDSLPTDEELLKNIKVTKFELFAELEKKEKILANYQNLENEQKKKALRFLLQVNKNILWVKKHIPSL